MFYKADYFILEDKALEDYFMEVDELSDTVRGESGFGSTTKWSV